MLRHTIEWELAPTVFLKDASMTRQEESACASTPDIGCGIPSNGNQLLTYPNCPPDIADGCEAYAGSRVFACKTRGIKDATGDDALAGSRPARCPELNIDGGLRAVRWGQVVKGATWCDRQSGETLLLLMLPQDSMIAPLAIYFVKSITSTPGYNTWWNFLLFEIYALVHQAPSNSLLSIPLHDALEAVLMPQDATTVTMTFEKLTSPTPGYNTTFLSLPPGKAMLMPLAGPLTPLLANPVLCASMQQFRVLVNTAWWTQPPPPHLSARPHCRGR